jgi:hypothetical protein
MRPDDQIAGLFGLQSSAGAQDNGYMVINPAVTLLDDNPGLGLPNVPLQIHGPAALYPTLGGTQPLATLYSAPGSATPYNAVTRFISGSARVAFAFDLARSVVLTRQGNPAWGASAAFTTDLFRPQAGVTWVDLNTLDIPQADEQQRLFANIVIDLADADAPMPQLWYFPDATKAVLLPTINTVSNPLSFLQPIISGIQSAGGRGTYFIGIGGLDGTDVAALRAAGNDVSILPMRFREDALNPVCCQINNLKEGFDKQTIWFQQNMQSLPGKGVRAENYQWAGWTEAAQYAADNGYGMDFSFATQGAWLKNGSTWARGYLNGSGRPMKFITSNGATINVYQQLTDLPDAQLMAAVSNQGEQLPVNEAFAVARDRIDASVNGNYAAVVMGVAANNLLPQQVDWATRTVQHAVSSGVSVLTASQWWAFNDARDTARISDITWNAATGLLAFNTGVTATTRVSITAVLPVVYGGRSLRDIRIDGLVSSYTINNVKLVNKAFVVLPEGAHRVDATYAPDAPIGNLTASIQSSAPHFLFRDVQFAASVDAGTGVSYLWDFGDGFFGSGPNPKHTYTRWGANNGRYTITITASNAAGKRVTTLPIQLTLPPTTYMPITVR